MPVDVLCFVIDICSLKWSAMVLAMTCLFRYSTGQSAGQHEQPSQQTRLDFSCACSVTLQRPGDCQLRLLQLPATPTGSLPVLQALLPQAVDGVHRVHSVDVKTVTAVCRLTGYGEETNLIQHLPFNATHGACR